MNGSQLFQSPSMVFRNRTYNNPTEWKMRADSPTAADEASGRLNCPKGYLAQCAGVGDSYPDIGCQQHTCSLTG